ncbi:peptidoglycan DD-metalloendopeptidase family protein [Nostoc sp. TCL26-01]|uniref:peptidoglycan DD-metalloendopeptidase family protein n=1 Tax=Nostoc sp. TCL26-01 TaxID=2576904 RepID=UPI0021199CA8|nr:peptidoglycan DD-metalloendopeptidase family protein [Nostoc sp. TCL26-01]
MLKNTPNSDDAPANQVNEANKKANRRARRQAAMIGLAISVGATSLLVTRQSDQAQAAAPVGSQKATSTIPAAETEVQPNSPKLATPVALSASTPENPVIVEPTAISQLPGLEAKLQVLASGKSIQLPSSEVVTGKMAHTTVINQQYQLGQTRQQPLTTANSAIAGENTLITTEPQIADSTTASEEINAQLKAQQEFALNRLKEKSNRLRSSLSELRPEESKDLSKAADLELTQPVTVTNQLPPLNTNSTVIEQPQTLANGAQDSFASTIKQPEAITIPISVQPATIAAPTNTRTYEVKPGDTLAAIASRYNTSVAELVKANNLSNPNQLQISQKLVIPVAGVNNSITAQTPVMLSSHSFQYPGVTKVAGSLERNPSVNQNLPITQPSVTTDNTVTTPASVNNQQQNNQVVTPETTSVSRRTQGQGGDSPVPKAFVEIQQPQNTGNRVARGKGDRLRSLQAEIQRLQAKYRTQESGNSYTEVANNESNDLAVPIPVASPNNLAVSRSTSGKQDFAVPIPVPTPLAPSYSNQTIQPKFRATRPVNEPVNPEFLLNPRVNQLTPSGRATPPRGTAVSPQLPPLAAVDQYLPQPIDETIPPPSTSATNYIWPAKGVLTSGFGQRWGRPHRGIDIAAPIGTPIMASADGVVEKAGWNNGGYGILVDIRHPDGSLTRYAHNSRLLVQSGQQVRQGQQIAAMGSTGFSTGSHSHFEIHPSGKGAVNPIAMLPPRGRV